MKSLYQSPLRVFMALALLAAVGIYSGLHLPISLYPNASKPAISVGMSYGGASAEDFQKMYGSRIEARLSSLNDPQLKLEKLEANYGEGSAHYSVEFDWGVSPSLALREVESRVNALTAAMPREIRDSVWTWPSNEDSGFLAISFYSSKESLETTYEALEPLLIPAAQKLPDLANVVLWNPSQQEILLELKPEAMASLQLVPRQIEDAIAPALRGANGGRIDLSTGDLQIVMPKSLQSIDDLKMINITSVAGRQVKLTDVARLDLRTQEGAASFKTSGAPSLILFAQPRADGNVKRMAEGILDIVHSAQPSFGADVHYKVLVDPSEFIRASVRNVAMEVLTAAFLAVLILFLFIGSLKNTITAAVEIPLSILLAFILMRLTGMNLNLISLGGLALSAGMNVDASVVVMENIFRHFRESSQREPKAPFTFDRRLEILVTAVKEVWVPVVASTIASLVVFIPLGFTSGLSHGILGDLAKAVAFSHGFSALVALILVPTVRLLMMRNERDANLKLHSPLEGLLVWLEKIYSESLRRFLQSPLLKWGSMAGLALAIALLISFVLPQIPKEIIGLPDTDFITLNVSAVGNSQIQQMESQAAAVESRWLELYGDDIEYTYSQVRSAGNAWLLGRLKNKKRMLPLWKAMETSFVDTPFLKFQVKPWNPSELPIPNPPQLRLNFVGGTAKDRAHLAQEFKRDLEASRIFPRVMAEPDISERSAMVIRPHWEVFSPKLSLTAMDLLDVARVATEGRRIDELTVGTKTYNMFIRYPKNRISSESELEGFPIGVNGKIVPLKTFASMQKEPVTSSIFSENQRPLAVVYGKLNKGDESKHDASKLEGEKFASDWVTSHAPQLSAAKIRALTEDTEKDLEDALKQLGGAVAVSVLLIFFTMMIQFGDVVSALLVLVSVPLGFLGVIISLWVFHSTLSLNSALGVILLNGLAVANSIILVDFLSRLVKGGMEPQAAALVVARKRLRPILITSLTTIVGMLPVALGLGDGGRILQPLGIAVAGGLWISTLTTLFLVPALQVSYLQWRTRRRLRIATAPKKVMGW